MSNKFTVYWLSGQKSYITGETFDEAINNAGYGKCQSVVDFWMPGINYEYGRDLVKKEWIKKEPIHMHIDDARKDKALVKSFIRENFDTSSRLIFDCEDGHELVVHLTRGIVTVYFNQRVLAGCHGQSNTAPQFQSMSIEHDDFENVERVIARVLDRLDTPQLVSNIPTIRLSGLSVIK